MKIVLLQRDKTEQKEGVSAYIQALAKKLSETESNEVSVQNETDFRAEDQDLLVVFGAHGLQYSAELKKGAANLNIAAVCNEFNESVRTSAQNADHLIIPNQPSSNEDKTQALLLKENNVGKILEIDSTQREFHLAEKISLVAQALQTFSLQKAQENDWVSSVNTWGRRAQEGLLDFYKNNSTAIKWGLGLTLMGGAAYAGSRTDTGKEILKSTTESLGMNRGPAGR